ncbi:outer membrane protein assembly factor BamB family protein [Pseudonocardia sp. TRM90224]|uniref:outer membrane protein assembly factor BamB family protein n=1 Tax=Pseudonocardia sp. TRM90224 TaxID=2812678 RepID=UPI001E38DF7C|nr:PQQ-binding-like beta-propeller repeat protein [Pseudonocardia sp. TRM90224]
MQFTRGGADTVPIHLPDRPPPPAPRVRPDVLAAVSVWRLVIAASALYGFSDATAWRQNLEGLSQQASLLTGVVYLGLLVYPACTGLRRHEPESPWLRGATAVLLLLVAGTFFGIMGGDPGYLPFEHIVTPLLVLVDWLAVGRNQAAARWWYPLTWIAFPLAYLVFFLSAGVYRSLYEFLDPREGGFVVIVVGLLVGVIAIGYLLYGVGKLKSARGRGTQPPPTRIPGPGHRLPPPQRDSGRKPRRIVIAAAIGATIVVAGVVGGVLLSSNGGGQSGARAAQDWAAAIGATGPAQELWRLPQGAAPGVQATGDHWVTDTHLVRRLPGRVVAHDLASGQVAWELPLPGEPGDDCPSSQQRSGTRVALLRAAGAQSSDCGTLTVVDIASGQEVFTTEIPQIERTAVDTADVPVVIGDFVLVGSRAGGHLFNIDTGKHVPVADEGQCREDAYAVVGDVLVARVSCRQRPPGSDVALSGLRAYDADLREQWSWRAPLESVGKPLEVRSVLSVEPLVVELYRAGTDTIETVRVDRGSNEVAPLVSRTRGATAESRYLAACEERGIAHCAQSRVVDGKLILTTIPRQINPSSEGAYPGMTSTEFRNELVAIDVGTGAEAWRTGMVDGRAMHLVPTTDGSIVTYQSANANDVPGLLLSIDAATGATTPLLPIAVKSHEDEKLQELLRSGRFGVDNQQATWTGERFVIFRMLQRAQNRDEAETVAFGRP